MFQGRTLANLLAVPGTAVKFDRSDILSRIAGCTWFNSEFISIGGISWLEHEIASTDHCYLSAQLAIHAMSRAQSFVELMQWANCLRECLMRGPVPQSGPLERLESILEEQSKQRSLNSFSRFSLSSKSNYVRSWSNIEWKQWKECMEELIDALRGGCPLHSNHSRYVRDPDGICCHGQ